jgi:hypothetical protein
MHYQKFAACHKFAKPAHSDVASIQGFSTTYFVATGSFTVTGITSLVIANASANDPKLLRPSIARCIMDRASSGLFSAMYAIAEQKWPTNSLVISPHHF